MLTNKILRNTTTLIIIYSLIALTFNACNKENNDPQGTANFNVHLKSSEHSRSGYEEVNIDIQRVSIHTTTDSTETTGWFDLEVNEGIYNLMDFMANDTLLAFDSLLQVQNVSQIRLILGDNNTIVDNGETYDLSTPSAQTSGIKVQVHADLHPNTSYIVMLDFDPEKSIIKTGNGVYKLKPVIKATVSQQ